MGLSDTISDLKYAFYKDPAASMPPQVRVTHPNGTDKLIEVWDGASWVVISYDSRWRDIRTLITGRASTVVSRALIRRVDDQVWFNLAIGDTEAGSSRVNILTIPQGFGNDHNFYTTGNHDADDSDLIFFRVGVGFVQYGGVKSLNNLHDALLTWPTSETLLIPQSDEFLPPFTYDGWKTPSSGVTNVVRGARNVSFTTDTAWTGLSLWGQSGLIEGEKVTVSVEASTSNARVQTWIDGTDYLQFPTGTGPRSKTVTVPPLISGLFDVVISASTAGSCSVTGLSVIKGGLELPGVPDGLIRPGGKEPETEI